LASIRSRPTSTGQPRWTVQYRHNGKQRTETFTRERDAKKFRDLVNALGPDEALRRLHGTASGGPVPTVAEWVEKHIADLTGVTDRTRADYRSLAAKHITPYLGPVHLDEVTSADISRWANQLETHANLSAKTIGNLRALLSSAFGYAVDEGLRGDNPMRRLRRSRAGEHEREDMTLLTPQEFALLRSLLPGHWRPFATFLAGTGLRFGEAAALRVSDVDLLASTPVVRVTKAWRRTANGFEDGPTKSRKSRRTVSLPADVVDVLAPLVTRPGDELLFTNQHGNRVLHANLWNKVWKPTVNEFEKATGKRPRLHDLRHSHISWLLAAGVPLTVVQDRAGHENITTTVGVYGHLMPDQHAKTAAALEGLLAERA
jgi:integrase